MTILALVFAAPLLAQEDVKVPDEVKPFVEAGSRAIAVEKGDLNGDGRQDYVLVLEKSNPQMGDDDFPVDQRPLLILTRGTDGKLSVAKRNDEIVMCSKCGGAFGDPFDGVRVGRNTFTVDHYGGSAWRWKYEYTFNYSRIDKTWQLVRVVELDYHTSNPNKMKTRRYTPRDFGKIDIADFDEGSYQKKGKK
jgi:hypothetical protein